MKIILEKPQCIGCSTCSTICDKFFELNEEENKAHLKNSKLNGENEELEIEEVGCAKEAAESCPVLCIKVS